MPKRKVDRCICHPPRSQSVGVNPDLVPPLQLIERLQGNAPNTAMVNIGTPDLAVRHRRPDRSGSRFGVRCKTRPTKSPGGGGK